MRPLKGICRGCTRVVEAATLNERRRCIRCAGQIPVLDCLRCGDQVPEPVLLEGRHACPPPEPLTDDRGTWPTTDGWRRIPCLRCSVRFWSAAKDLRLCSECQAIAFPSFASPTTPTDAGWRCLRCRRCNGRLVSEDATLCDECEHEVMLYPDGSDEMVGRFHDFQVLDVHYLINDERASE